MWFCYFGAASSFIKKIKSVHQSPKWGRGRKSFTLHTLSMQLAHTVVFIDTEVSPNQRKVTDAAALFSTGQAFHGADLRALGRFVAEAGFLCGHNIIRHDLGYLQHVREIRAFGEARLIDTLLLSPLLFPEKPYHRLVKDDRLAGSDENNPLNDAQKARDLFYDEVSAFNRLDAVRQRVYAGLLCNQPGFGGFFRLLGLEASAKDAAELIPLAWQQQLCAHAPLTDFIRSQPVELAYALALADTRSNDSLTPRWVLKSFPKTEAVLEKLRNRPCAPGCAYCRRMLDPVQGLRHFFGYEAYRSFDGQPLQEQAVQAALDGDSLLAVFPTGGGKSLTFQVPALMAGENTRGLTVVISPLQSLMKDQVDNLIKKGVTRAVTINGLLDPIERSVALEQIENGQACMLYISPESLRSSTIERLLTGRKIVRFVIDEAHCFSSWGQDFRVDYLYIGKFIRRLQQLKQLSDPIPVSCFTATAKKQVIEDICTYFSTECGLQLRIFKSSVRRINLAYEAFETDDEERKYQKVRELVSQHQEPAIVYVSRTARTTKIADRLKHDGIAALAFHGQMDKDEKTANQDAFMRGEVQVMVATSAFGMGVDKEDVQLVIHFDISDSLENYVQEAGRAGRNPALHARCFILFNEEDLDKHFLMLNQTRLSIQEIKQVWQAVKLVTKNRATASQSALELARNAGWDDSVRDIETRVKTALSALEESGYLSRKHNSPRVYCNSILPKTAQEAIDMVEASGRFTLKQKTDAVRILKSLYSAKSRTSPEDETAESRVDYLSDRLAIPAKDVISIVQLLREIDVLADAKDLSLHLQQGERENRSLGILSDFMETERFLLARVKEKQKHDLRELSEALELESGVKGGIKRIKTLIYYWSVKSHAQHKWQHERKAVALALTGQAEAFAKTMQKRHELARFMLQFLFGKAAQNAAASGGDTPARSHLRADFSVKEMLEAWQQHIRGDLIAEEAQSHEIEEALFYLSRIGAVTIDGSFIVIYNRLTLERLETDQRVRYKKQDYTRLEQHYQQKTEQIHIVGEYAKRLLKDYRDALEFVNDYFELDYEVFLSRYFGSSRREITRTITPGKFKKLFGALSPRQLSIVKEQTHPYVAVAAGPGSGKTRVLVHKLAALLLTEDVKQDQLLMLTFSRAAALEFKMRLRELIGNAAHFVKITTFHSYCFELSGRLGNLEKADKVIPETVAKIKSGEIERSQITKSVLVIDEAQDMDENEFALIKALMQANEEMRVVAVGDDDQNIYAFRGSDSRYFAKFWHHRERTAQFEMTENYRSAAIITRFGNRFVRTISQRMKTTPIHSKVDFSGELHCTRYRPGSRLILPVSEAVWQNGISGTTAVLTRTNEEALLLNSLLRRKGLPSRLIQSNEGFSLYSLREIRFFVEALQPEEGIFTITAEEWEEAIRKTKLTFSGSTQLETCLQVLGSFRNSSGKTLYRNDLIQHLKESQLDDYLQQREGSVLVSTMHKAKGREFDTVYVLFERAVPSDDEERRLLYVAFTRARKKLYLHVNSDYFESLLPDGAILSEDDTRYPEPDLLSEQLTHKDVWLGFFRSKAAAVSRLKSGDQLRCKGECLLNENGAEVIRFSRKYQETIRRHEARGFQLKQAEVAFVVWWQPPDEGLAVAAAPAASANSDTLDASEASKPNGQLLQTTKQPEILIVLPRLLYVRAEQPSPFTPTAESGSVRTQHNKG
ncbi:MAG: RecQ family ATP-dependent DNA helicase [Balneolales bacterium]|nr:RecQ family ATP-dependent DNA helicase [Balneolales bacterium]